MTLIFQSITMSMAVCVFRFNAYFIQNPLPCFFSYNYFAYTPYFDSYYGLAQLDSLVYIKPPLIRDRLSAGVLMFASCTVCIVIFVVTMVKVSKSTRVQSNASTSLNVIPEPYRHPPSYMISVSGDPYGLYPCLPQYVNYPFEYQVYPIRPRYQVNCSYYGGEKVRAPC